MCFIFVYSNVYVRTCVVERHVCLWERGYKDCAVHISGLFTGCTQLYQSEVRASTLTLTMCAFICMLVCRVCSLTVRMSCGSCKELSDEDQSTADSGGGLARTVETSMKTVHVCVYICWCVCV